MTILSVARVSVLSLSFLPLPLLSLSAAAPTVERVDPIPLVVWHGLGDDYTRREMQELAQLADEVNPGTYVHFVHLGDSGSEDREASFLGNVTAQVDQVCEQLATEPVLRNAPGINALGFSQGGQFLRAFVERCNRPRVHNLVTFGSQHNGITKFQSCADRGDWICRSAESLLQLGKWSEFVQSRLVPAQYYRDPEKLDEYLEYSNFLADINNERPVKNMDYRHNLMALNKFVMFMFDDDELVVPKETAHFAEVNQTTGEVTPLSERQIFKKDWLGLAKLAKENRLEFFSLPYKHMQIPEVKLEETFRKYFRPVKLNPYRSPVSPLKSQEGPPWS